MGCFPSNCYCPANELPQQSVVVNSLQIADIEVTFEEFDLFCKDTGAVEPEDDGYGRYKQPVINVSWHDANRYINWLPEKKQQQLSASN